MKTIGQVLIETIPEAIHIILKENGLEIIEETGDETHFDRVSVIGFSGNGFGGALGFAVEQAILKVACDEDNRPLSDGWIGEVANQLLSRFKNALLVYGLEIQVTIPMVLHGIGLQIQDNRSWQVKQFYYNSGYGHIRIWVDANWDISRELQLAESDQHPQPEGQMVLF